MVMENEITGQTERSRRLSGVARVEQDIQSLLKRMLRLETNEE